MSKIEQAICEIMDYIFNTYGENAELKVGIWDESVEPYTFYASIVSPEDQKVLLGETSFDTDTIEEAFSFLIDEMIGEEDEKKG
jgi:hypothetical protein